MAAAAAVMVKSPLRRINTGELFNSVRKEREAGRPFTFFCANRDRFGRELIKAKVHKVLKESGIPPSFSVMFHDPISPVGEVFVDISRSGEGEPEVKFFTS